MARLDDADRLLVEENVGFAKSCAKRWIRRLGAVIEPEELFSIAYVALCESASRWTPDGGASFHSFLFRRINGAIIDESRVRLGRTGTDRPHRIPFSQLVSIEKLDEAGFQIDAEDAGLAEVDARLFVDEALARLTERERFVLTMVIFEGLSQFEIAELLGVSQSRVSQNIASAGARLLKTKRIERIANVA